MEYIILCMCVSTCVFYIYAREPIISGDGSKETIDTDKLPVSSGDGESGSGETATSSDNLIAPDAPSNFAVRENKTNSLILVWEKGFNGGHPQTFVIRYTDTVTGGTQEKNIEDTSQKINYVTEITGLTPGTIYLFWIYATNVKGNSSDGCKPLIAKTQKDWKEFQDCTTAYALVGGLAGSVFTVIVIVWIITVVIKNRRNTNKTQKNGDKQADVQLGDANKDGNTIPMAELSACQMVGNLDNASKSDVNVSKTQEDDETKQVSEVNIYETVKNTEGDEVSVENNYVNLPTEVVEGKSSK